MPCLVPSPGTEFENTPSSKLVKLTADFPSRQRPATNHTFCASVRFSTSNTNHSFQFLATTPLVSILPIRPSLLRRRCAALTPCLNGFVASITTSYLLRPPSTLPSSSLQPCRGRESPSQGTSYPILFVYPFYHTFSFICTFFKLYHYHSSMIIRVYRQCQPRRSFVRH
jgi:hypothetical protein